MRDRAGMFQGGPEQVALGYRNGIHRIPRAFARLQVPIIAAINGPAIDAGLDLASMCDIRLAASTAKFAESFVKLGIIPGDGGCWFLPRLVGPSRAAEMVFTGQTLDAQEALRIGYVSRVCAPERLLEQALALAESIAQNPAQAVRWSKELLRASAAQSLDEALDHAGRLQGLAHQTAEHAAAVAAFFARSRT
jgi:2-(1,2-epoxy-1,2-dihydrophenyl)acetyl-CoA isomerase